MNPNLEDEMNNWMDEHQTEIFDMIREAMDEFQAAHPGTDQDMVRLNALSMANRRFLARAVGQVVGKYLTKPA